jgi:ADP-ribose pyrophosphatase YjhB (NUDIX family)
MKKMDSELAEFLASGIKVAEDSTIWDEGRMPLAITYRLSDTLPPLKYVSSVRAVLLHNDKVMVVRDGKNHYHILPGGRREEHETLEETLRREILEETGWTMKGVSLLGFIYLHHLSPRPPDYTFPYPDFLWTIYMAEADRYLPEKQVQGKYELEADFRFVDETRELLDEPGQLAFLEATIKLQGK